MPKTQKPTITIIGAGLAGCFFALLLAKRGHKVDIYERTEKAEITSTTSRRSFNITFYGYAVQVLQDAGLWDLIKPYILTLEGSITQVTRDSKPIFAKLDKEKMPYYSVQRAKLLELFMREALRHPLITLHFGTNLLAIDRVKKTITIQNRKTAKIQTVACSVIFGADGVNSLTRTYMQQGRESSHSQEYAAWSYKQIMFPKEWIKKLRLQKNVAYTWSRKEAVIASFPNLDGSRPAILTLPKEKKKGFASLTSPAAIKHFVKDQFPMLSPALPIITESILHNPEGNFVTIHTNPWYYKDFIAILGDAAHGFYPFFGQGTSAAFGDGMALAQLVDTYGTNWEKIFPLYQESRKSHMDTLGELSKKGFARYRRHKKADYGIIYDHFDGLLHKLLPQYFPVSLYESITRDPGRTADYLKQHQKQRRMTALLGSSLLVAAVTTVVAMHEKIGFKSDKRRS